jgi:hypothetical protein
VIAVAVFVASLVVATRGLRGRPAPNFGWLMGALGAFYAIAAVVAATAAAEYVLATMLAALIPYSAALLLYATARSKTQEEEGRRRDASAEDLGPWPGIGADDETPLGDTPEHSEEEPAATRRHRDRGR